MTSVGARLRGLARSRLLRVVVGLAAVVALVLTLSRQWHELAPRVHQLSALSLAGAEVAVLGAVVATMLSWRALLHDLGSELPLLPAMRIFFLGQLGKYLPGSVWAVVAQVELGADLGIPRRRSATAAAMNLLLSLLVGSLVAGSLLAPVLLPVWTAPFVWAVAAAVVTVSVRPRLVGWLVDRLLRLFRRPPLEQGFTARGLLRAELWALVSWLLFGLQLWLVARELGSAGALLVLRSVGAFAAAWVIGFLVIPAPAGAGVREVVLAVALSGSLSTAGATLAALVSRVLLTVGDLLVGAAAAASLGPRGVRRLRGRSGGGTDQEPGGRRATAR